MYFPACTYVYHIYVWGTQRPEEGARSSRYNVGTGYQSLPAPCFEKTFFFLRQDLTTYSLSLELRNIWS